MAKRLVCFRLVATTGCAGNHSESLPTPGLGIGGTDRARRVAQAIPPLAKNRFAGLTSLRLAVGAHAGCVAPIPNGAIVGRLAVLGPLSMANVHGSLGATLQTRPDIEREISGGQDSGSGCLRRKSLPE